MKFALTLAILLLAFPVQAKNLHLETEYQAAWCPEMKGDMEYVLPDRTRVDCLLDDYAVEMDFARKWHEAIGQALFYANMTGRRPGVVLIMEDPERDYRYLIRLLKGISMTDLKWRVWVMNSPLMN